MVPSNINHEYLYTISLIIALNFHPKGWLTCHLHSSENENVPSLLKVDVMPIGPFEVKTITMLEGDEEKNSILKIWWRL
jgi:hypothetical protein